VLPYRRSQAGALELLVMSSRQIHREVNRLNRERRSSGGSDRRELKQTEIAIREIVAVIEQGGFHRALLALEAKRATLQESLAKSPADMPDLDPNIAKLYRRKVARHSEALDHPEDRHGAHPLRSDHPRRARLPAVQRLKRRLAVPPAEQAL